MSNADEEYTLSEMYRLGIDCLVSRFGIVNTEKFLVAVKTDSSDYTKWRQGLFEDMTLDEYDASVMKYGETHPKKAGRQKN